MSSCNNRKSPLGNIAKLNFQYYPTLLFSLPESWINDPRIWGHIVNP